MYIAGLLTGLWVGALLGFFACALLTMASYTQGDINSQEEAEAGASDTGRHG